MKKRGLTLFDINFFSEITETRNKALDVTACGLNYRDLYDSFEGKRSAKPYLFNIETTNICNMRCIMCPRTNLMNRKIEVMDQSFFSDIISQINPHSANEIEKFETFIVDTYGIEREEKSENAFYFYTVAKHVTLHGYGEPLLDPLIVERVKVCSIRNIPTYFSCVPANIDLGLIEKLMAEGLGVIKFSIDALSDEGQKRIRGAKNNYTEAYKKILGVVGIKQKNNYATKIVITFIDLSSRNTAKKDKKQFLNIWQDEPVYSYIKSQDNKWLYEDKKATQNKSHYDASYCEFPWTSMSVMVDGSVVPCTQDYNNEMSLGNAKIDALEKIWNCEKYDNFRKQHFSLAQHGNLKCIDRCDIKTISQRFLLKNRIQRTRKKELNE